MGPGWRLLTWHWHLSAMDSHLTEIEGYRSLGWVRIPFDVELLDWVSAALPAARDAVRAPENADWHVCEGTWFIGVNALPNEADGSVDGKTPLRGRAVETVAALGFSIRRWDRAQISVIYPGYPRPREEESAAAFAYRKYRDAAHVDGLTRVGSGRRMLHEPHAFIMGVPLTRVGPSTSYIFGCKSLIFGGPDFEWALHRGTFPRSLPPVSGLCHPPARRAAVFRVGWSRNGASFHPRPRLR